MQRDKLVWGGRATVYVILASVLAACGGGGVEPPVPALDLDHTQLVETTLFGSVGDGPITGGQVTVETSQGAVLATESSNDLAQYLVRLSASPEDFPLIARVADGTDLVTGGAPSFALLTTVLRPGGEQVANLNPHGTLAIKTAQSMAGGLNGDNLAAAFAAIRQTFDFGLDGSIASDPISTVVSRESLAGVVRSSEALGEAIRRAHDALLSSGEFADEIADENALLDALGADLADGVLDGAGGGEAGPRLAATVSIVSAQVLLETMTNRLMVGGVPAAGALDASIQQVMSGDTTVPLTDTLRVTSTMLAQARVALDAAAAIDPNPDLMAARDALDLMVSGQSAAEAAALLPDGAGIALGSTIQQISVATPEELALVNDIVSNGTPPPADEPTNSLPEISGSPDTEIMAGSEYEFVPVASDADGDALTFSVAGLPDWATLEADTGRVAGMPKASDVGTSDPIQITASDGFGRTVLPAFRITVTERQNRAPTIAGSAPAGVTVGNTYEFIPTASDADGDTLVFSATNVPAWASFDTSTGRLAGVPKAADADTFPGIEMTVSDGEASDSLPPFSISVSSIPNQAPTISGTPATVVTVDENYSFTPSAADVDSNDLQFQITGKPIWAIFNATTGRLSGTPGDAHEGDYADIRISVTDGTDSAALPSFAITVAGVPNQPPTISGSPARDVTVDSTYSFSPTASDPDDDPLSFEISGRPSWASFDTGSGRLSGRPDAADEATYSGIRITVFDGSARVSLSSFSITVNGLPNGAPEISGSPSPQVFVDADYSFTPAATDPDNDTLTFAVSGLPSWASFDTRTGELWGTPGTTHESTYTGIRISVSDGDETVSLPVFSISVVSQAVGFANVFWVPPEENEDGTQLNDLAGFYVHYGPAINNYTHVVKIDNPTVTSHLVEDLVPGTWFFVVTAYDESDNESVHSEVGSKLIQQP